MHTRRSTRFPWGALVVALVVAAVFLVALFAIFYAEARSYRIGAAEQPSGPSQVAGHLAKDAWA